MLTRRVKISMARALSISKMGQMFSCLLFFERSGTSGAGVVHAVPRVIYFPPISSASRRLRVEWSILMLESDMNDSEEQVLVTKDASLASVNYRGPLACCSLLYNLTRGLGRYIFRATTPSLSSAYS